MTPRWLFPGLLSACVACCAGPLLIALAAVATVSAWQVAILALGMSLVVVAIAVRRRRRACVPAACSSSCRADA